MLRTYIAAEFKVGAGDILQAVKEYCLMSRVHDDFSNLT